MILDAEKNPQQTEFLNKISSLTRSILIGGERHRTNATSVLLDGVRRDPSFDSVLFTIEQVQDLIRMEGPKLKILRNAGELIEVVVDAAREPKPNNAQTYISLDDPKVAVCIARILDNNRGLKTIPDIYKIFPGIYEYLVEQTLPYALSAKDNGIDKLLMARVPRESIQDANKAVLEHNEWTIQAGGLLEDRDAYIDHLRKEPDVSQMTGEEGLMRAKFSGISLADIENMQRPLGSDDIDRIADYIIAALSPAEQDPNILASRCDQITKLFFMPPTVFHKEFGKAEVKNRKLLANINNWKESFINYLVIGGYPGTDEKVKKIFGLLHHSVGILLVQDLCAFTVRPHIYDPDYDYAAGNFGEIIPRHLLVSLALSNSPEARKGAPTFRHVDEISYAFLRNELLSRLRNRIAELGFEEKFHEDTDFSAGFFKEDYLKELHIRELKSSFEHMCGPDFLERLKERADELEKVAYVSWHSLFDRGMHYLPMSGGVNVIEFSKDGVSDMIGFRSLKLHRMGTPQDWEIALEFQLKAGGLSVIGKIDQNGVLHLNDPIAEEIPQLHKLLSLVATLAFHDLVVQEKGQAGKSARKTSSPKEQKPNNEDKADAADIEIYRSFGKYLPRRQTDASLIREVYRHTGFKPRRVEIHRSWLPGADEYKAAVDVYNEAKTDNVPALTLEWARKELEEARKQSRKASEAKIKSMPPHLQLEHITDPVTDEVRYLRTWVVEHTSPKPTEDELKSPVRLFERYYSKSSALSFLDQMKPWFIGE